MKAGTSSSGPSCDEFGFVRRDKIEPHLHLEPRLGFFAFQLRDGLLQELAVEIEADRHDVAALGRAEDAAGAANFEIAHGDAKARAERAVLLDRVDPLARCAHGHHLAREQQIGVGLVLGAADAAAELIEIGQAEAIGAIDDDGVGVRNIEAALDDRGADEHVDFSGDETLHDVFEFVRVHLAVAEVDPRLRTKLGDAIAHFLDRLHAVVQKIDLALALELAIDRVADDPLVVAADDRLDRAGD